MDDVLEDFFSFDQPAATLVSKTLRQLADAHPPASPEGKLNGYLAGLKLKGHLQFLKGGAAMSSLARNKLRDLRPDLVTARFSELLRHVQVDQPVSLEKLHPLLYRVRKSHS
jgi:hypothetical protein